MELASMLAGEPFSDHPRSVSPVIATFLRSYNDIVDDERRQDLYRYAADVVGTAGAEHAEYVRAERLIEWADGIEAARSRWSPFVRLSRRSAHAIRHKGTAEAARYAIRVLPRISDRSHAHVLSLLDELIAVESTAVPTPASASAPLTTCS